MKKVQEIQVKMAAVLCVAAVLTSCAAAPGTGVEGAASDAGAATAQQEAQGRAADGETAAPAPGDEELAFMLRLLREADETQTSVWWNSSEGELEKLRIKSELLGGVADVLATQPNRRQDDGVTGVMYTEASLDISFPAPNQPDQRSSEMISAVLLADQKENGLFAGEMMVSFNDRAGNGAQYFYRREAYDGIAQVLAQYRAPEGVTLQGDYVRVESGYASRQEGYDTPQIADVLQLDNQLMLLWGMYPLDEGLPRSAVEVVDAKTGQGLDDMVLDGQALYLEKTDASPYHYRTVFQDKVEYRSNSDAGLVKSYTPPAGLPVLAWDIGIYRPAFDVDLGANLLAYAAADGIYLGDTDGGGARQALSNGDILACLGARASEEEAPQLCYAAPLLMNGGKQLVATMYRMPKGNQDGDTAPCGFTILDIETGEQRHVTDIAWLSSVSRLDSRRVEYVGDLPCAMDIVTMDKQEIEFDLEIGTFDYQALVRVDAGRNQEGEATSELSVYSAQNPAEKTILLTAQNGQIRIRAVTEGYILCMISDGVAGEPEGYVVLPY